MYWATFLAPFITLSPILAYDLSYFPPVNQVPPVNTTLTRLLLAGKNVSTSSTGEYGTSPDDILGCISTTDWAISCEYFDSSNGSKAT